MGDSNTSTVMPHPTLTKILGEPTAMDIAVLERELLENAGSMRNTVSRRFGHAGMLMTPGDYQALANKAGYKTPAWKEPKDPGAPPKFKASDNIKAYTVLEKQWNAKSSAFDDYQNGKGKLKSQILEAVGPQFFRDVRDSTDTMMGVGPKELLDHLKSTYGHISSVEIYQNAQKLDEPWDGRGPIDEYWEKLQKVRDFAKFAKSPIDDISCINTVLNCMAKLPDFAMACYEQRNLAHEAWTWQDMKARFNKANKNRSNKTTGDHGYNTANAAVAVNKSNTASEKTNASPRERRAKPPVSLNKFEWVSAYCWSCGWSHDREHNSQNCTKKKPGHRDDATAYDNKGGCQDFTPRKRPAKDTPDNSPKKK
jgi:hypothetical protein